MLHRGVVVLFLALLAGTGQGSTDWGGPAQGPLPALYRSSDLPVKATPFVGWNALDLPLPAGDVRWPASCVQDALDETGAIHLRWRAEEQVGGHVILRLLVQPSEDYVAGGLRTGHWRPTAISPREVVLVTRWRSPQSISLDWPLRNATDGRILNWPVQLQLTMTPKGMEVTHHIGVCRTVHGP